MSEPILKLPLRADSNEIQDAEGDLLARIELRAEGSMKALRDSFYLATEEAEEVARRCNVFDALLAALRQAVDAGSYVVKLCEANDRAGVSASPTEKSDYVATAAHCYAAMSFLSMAHEAIALAEKGQP